MATCFFVVEAINSHICFDNLRRSVVKRRGNVHLGGNGYSHLRGEDCAVGALDAGWGDKKDSGHGGYIIFLASSTANFLSCSGGISDFRQASLYISESFNLLIFDKYPSN